jgi:hypothetical protein
MLVGWHTTEPTIKDSSVNAQEFQRYKAPSKMLSKRLPDSTSLASAQAELIPVFMQVGK